MLSRTWALLSLLLCLNNALVTLSVGKQENDFKAPYFEDDATRTSSSLLVYFEHMLTHAGGDAISYELSKRSMFNTHWETVNSEIGNAGYNISEAQIINIRVDVSSTISGGTFELGMTRNALTPDDHEHPARTTPIPYSATAAQMKTALEALANVKVREVRRCDEFGDGGGTQPVGWGGAYFESWVSGCPQGALGAFRWLVVFDVPVAGDFVPNLYNYRNDLVGLWTGSGPQVSVARINRGMINPAQCLYNKCSFNVTGLQEGTPYAFRTRVMTSATGWTAYSKTSVFKQTLEPRAPR